MADLRAIEITSTRLGLRSFKAEDATESFAEVTPTLTRFMAWDPSPSLAVFAEIWRGWLPRMAAGTHLALTIRLQSTAEFMGTAGLLCIGQPEPEIGIWIKEAGQSSGCRLYVWSSWKRLPGRTILGGMTDPTPPPYELVVRACTIHAGRYRWDIRERAERPSNPRLSRSPARERRTRTVAK
jgi:hypothetical protein